MSDNGAVVLLDNGGLRGELVMEGNRAILYGDSPAEVAIEGDIALRGNGSLVRGITVEGNVTFEGNNAVERSAAGAVSCETN